MSETVAARAARDRPALAGVPGFPQKSALRAGNHLIEDLPDADRAALLQACQPFEFAVGELLFRPGDLPATLEFVDSGVVSALAVMTDGRTVEVFMVGREGATHPLALDGAVRSPLCLVGQIAGAGRRIDLSRLRVLAEERPAIRRALAGYAARLAGEVEQSAACNALHRADQRFAKWLLRCHDRTDGDVLSLTQEALASMLGSQRTTVNDAAQRLQGQGAIRYIRGRINVLDRVALERSACECYGLHVRAMHRGDPPGSRGT